MNNDNQDITLKSITIENFKAFGAPVTIPFKPITLLFGENSAGKSSILKALVYLRAALIQGHHPKHAEASGERINFGSFLDVVHQHDRRHQIRIAVDFDFPKANADKKSRQSVVHLNTICKRSIRTGRIEITISSASDTVYADVWLNDEHVWCCDIMNGDISFDSDAALITELFLDPQREWLTTEQLKNIDLNYRAYEKIEFGRTFNNYEFTPEYRDEDLQEDIRELHDTFFGEQGFESDHRIYAIGAIPIRLAIRALSRQLRYIGPMRDIPRRDEPIRLVGRKNWFKGKAAWKELELIVSADAPYNGINVMLDESDQPPLFKDAQEEALDQIGQLKLGYVPAFKSICSVEFPVDKSKTLQEQGTLKEKLIAATQDDDANHLQYSVRHQLVLKDESGMEVHPLDTGTGVSQALPIAVGAFAEGCNLMAVEQPELHLHPRLQCELGDIFIANTHRHPDRTFILETHSEHIILRLLRRMRETAAGKAPKGRELTPDDVAVLAFEAGEHGTEVHEMEISESGELLTPWPNGFFPERMNEILGE